MDIKDKVEARRRQLAEAQRAENEAAAQAQLKDREDDLEERLNNVSLIDLSDTTQKERRVILARESKKLWSPEENRNLMLLIVAGLLLIWVSGLGVVVWLLAIVYAQNVGNKYRSLILERCPLFD